MEKGDFIGLGVGLSAKLETGQETEVKICRKAVRQAMGD
jgi:hypothetical protein